MAAIPKSLETLAIYLINDTSGKIGKLFGDFLEQSDYVLFRETTIKAFNYPEQLQKSFITAINNSNCDNVRHTTEWIYEKMNNDPDFMTKQRDYIKYRPLTNRGQDYAFILYLWLLIFH